MSSDTKFKRRRTVQSECPHLGTLDADHCCCKGAAANRPVKDCHNLRVTGGFCDACKRINCDKAKSVKAMKKEKALQKEQVQLEELQKLREAALQREQVQRDELQKLQEHLASEEQKKTLQASPSDGPSALFTVPLAVRVNGFEVLRSNMLHVLEDIKVVEEFARAWPWLDSNTPRPLLQKPGVKYVVEDSIHPDSSARQYRLHFLMQEHARARDTAERARAKIKTTAYVNSDFRHQPLNASIQFLAKYCSALLRRTDLPVEIQLMCTPAGAAAQLLHLDSLLSSFLALAVPLNDIHPMTSTIFADYPFVMPEDGKFRQSIPMQSWDQLTKHQFQLSLGDAVAWHTSKIHAGPGNAASQNRYVLFFTWPANPAALTADTEEPMFHQNWVEYIQNSSKDARAVLIEDLQHQNCKFFRNQFVRFCTH